MKNEPCGCCEGVERLTPVSNANRPGLSALAYRAGTHATFFETMLARLSSHRFAEGQGAGGAGPHAGPGPLHALTTRETRDPAVGFLDAWATVADVLTFYQERIANEGFLRTATERRSVLELARLLGYEPRPGVAASAHLAYTLDEGATVIIPAGTRAGSVPGPGETPQTFETAEDFEARAEWNLLQPRLTRPAAPRLRKLAAGRPLYFKGTSTNLRPNDPLIVDFGAAGVAAFRVVGVEPDQAADRTKVSVQLWAQAAAPAGAAGVKAATFEQDEATPGGLTVGALIRETQEIAELHSHAEDFSVNSATQTAQRVLGHLEILRSGVLKDPTRDGLQKLLDSVLPPLLEEHRLAREGNFTKLEPWIGSIVEALLRVAANLAVASETGGSTSTTAPVSTSMPSPLASSPLKSRGEPLPALVQLGKLLDDLEKPPRSQPASKKQLGSGLANTLSPESDALPRLLTALRPAIGPALYRAWGNLPVTTPAPTRVYALRARASVFGHNAPLKQIPREGAPPLTQEWTLEKEGTQTTPPERFVVGIGFVNQFGPVVVGVSFIDEEGLPRATATHNTDLVEKTAVLSLPQVEETVTLRIRDLGFNRERATFDLTFESRKFTVTVDWEEFGASATAASAGNNLVSVTHQFNANAITGQPRGSVTVEGTVSRPAGPTYTEQADAVSLDTTYKEVLPDSWVMLERPWRLVNGTSQPELPLVTKVTRVTESTRADYGITAKGTQLQLARTWIEPATDKFELSIRTTGVYALSEELELAPEPLDPVEDNLCGNRIELANLVSGLEPGRWLIVSGERTDVKSGAPEGEDDEPGAGGGGGPAALEAAGATGTGGAGGAAKKEPVPGLEVAELVMLAGVEQGFDARLPGDSTHTTLLLARELAYCYKLDTVRIYGNVVRATHGETHRDVLGSGDAGKAMQSFALSQSPLTYVSAPTTSGVETTLTVRVNDVRWREADSLAGLGPRDRRYVTRTDDEGKTAVVFGNGFAGARLPNGTENVRATYRTGIGASGNVKAAQIATPTDKPLGVKEVVNPLAATGGAGRESRDEARRNAPLAVMSLDRLVSTSDYQDFARTFAGVGKASAARISDGRRQVVHLTIAGADDIPIAPDSDLYRNLRAALGKFGDPYQPVQIATRLLKVLVVGAGVRVHPDYLWESVEPKVRAALLDRFSFNRRDLGQDVTLSEVVAAAQAVEGVAYVDVDTLDALEEGVSTATLLRVAGELKLNRRIRAHLARVDRTALDPEARIRPAQLAVLTPLVPETLNLTELK